MKRYMGNPTEQEIQENLVKVKNGEALTMPLAILGADFKERYREKVGSFECGSISPISSLEPYMQKCKCCGRYFTTMIRNKVLCSKSCSEEYSKKYNQRPEVKERKRKYGREYNQRPEVKERIREYAREYNRKDYRKRNNVPKSKWRVK